MVPESVAAVFPRPDIAYVPLADVPPGTVALAWNGDRPSPLVETFVDATRTTAPGVTRPRLDQHLPRDLAVAQRQHRLESTRTPSG